MDKTWFCRRGDKQIGPFTDAEMHQLVQQKKVQPADTCWKQGMPAWIPIEVFLNKSASPAPPKVVPVGVALSSVPPPIQSGAAPALPQVNTSPRRNPPRKTNVPLLIGGIVGGIVALFFGMCLCCGMLGAIVPKENGGSLGGRVGSDGSYEKGTEKKYTRGPNGEQLLVKEKYFNKAKKPDGSPQLQQRYQYFVDKEGKEVQHGDFQSWYPDGEPFCKAINECGITISQEDLAVTGEILSMRQRMYFDTKDVYEHDFYTFSCKYYFPGRKAEDIATWYVKEPNGRWSAFVSATTWYPNGNLMRKITTKDGHYELLEIYYESGGLKEKLF